MGWEGEVYTVLLFHTEAALDAGADAFAFCHGCCWRLDGAMCGIDSGLARRISGLKAEVGSSRKRIGVRRVCQEARPKEKECMYRGVVYENRLGTVKDRKQSEDEKVRLWTSGGGDEDP